MNIEELKNNLVEDFQEYLKENGLKIAINWIVNECYINNYLMSIFYNIEEYTETPEEAEKIQNEFYIILNKFCCNYIPSYF